MSPGGAALTPDQVQLFLDPNLASLVTLMPDGSPQASPVWIDYRDGLIWVNTLEGRVKHRNVLRDPRVAVTVVDRGDDNTWVGVTGTVVEITTDGAEDHIDELSRKYRGVFPYPDHHPTRSRVLLKIKPEKVTG